MADRSHLDRNDASRERLRAVLGRLEPGDYGRELDGGWTVGALLVHLAFWDRLVVERWDLARRAGAVTPADLPDPIADLVNDAERPTWRALEPAAIARLVTTAADEVDAAVAALPDASVDALLAEGRPRLVDRSRHRTEHLDLIEAALG